MWVKAFKAGIKLRIPARGSSSCSGGGFVPFSGRPSGLEAPAPAAGEPPGRGWPAPWYVRLIAVSGELRD